MSNFLEFRKCKIPKRSPTGIASKSIAPLIPIFWKIWKDKISSKNFNGSHQMKKLDDIAQDIRKLLKFFLFGLKQFFCTSISKNYFSKGSCNFFLILQNPPKVTKSKFTFYNISSSLLMLSVSKCFW